MNLQRVISIYAEILFHKAAMLISMQIKKCLSTQARFVSNTEQHKAGLIECLSLRLEVVGFCVVNCSGDADSTIVKTAFKGELMPKKKFISNC